MFKKKRPYYSAGKVTEKPCKKIEDNLEKFKKELASAKAEIEKLKKEKERIYTDIGFMRKRKDNLNKYLLREFKSIEITWLPPEYPSLLELQNKINMLYKEVNSLKCGFDFAFVFCPILYAEYSKLHTIIIAAVSIVIEIFTVKRWRRYCMRSENLI